ncbi:hypothetical protein ScPMuIL_012056 [Solemya velum]
MQVNQLRYMTVGDLHLTIITFDLALYEKVVQLLDSRADLKCNVIPRLGELHVVMAALRAIGVSMENSGIDDAWMEADVYGPATTRQILECTHYKRSLHAHIYSYIALYELALDEFFKDFPQLKEASMKAVEELEYTLLRICESGIYTGNALQLDFSLVEKAKDPICRCYAQQFTDTYINITSLVYPNMTGCGVQIYIGDTDEPTQRVYFGCVAVSYHSGQLAFGQTIEINSEKTVEHGSTFEYCLEIQSTFEEKIKLTCCSSGETACLNPLTTTTTTTTSVAPTNDNTTNDETKQSLLSTTRTTRSATTAIRAITEASTLNVITKVSTPRVHTTAVHNMTSNTSTTSTVMKTDHTKTMPMTETNPPMILPANVTTDESQKLVASPSVKVEVIAPVVVSAALLLCVACLAVVICIRRKKGKKCGKKEDMNNTGLTSIIPENHVAHPNESHYTVDETGEEYALVQKRSRNRNIRDESEGRDHKCYADTVSPNLESGHPPIDINLDNFYITPKLLGASKNLKTIVYDQQDPGSQKTSESSSQDVDGVTTTDVECTGKHGSYTNLLDAKGDEGDHDNTLQLDSEHPDGLLYVELEFPAKQESTQTAPLNHKDDQTIYSEVTPSVTVYN